MGHIRICVLIIQFLCGKTSARVDDSVLPFRGLIRRDLSGFVPKTLSNEEADTIMSTLQSAGASSDTNMFSVHTSTARGFTISQSSKYIVFCKLTHLETSAGDRLSTWTASSSATGDTIAQNLSLDASDIEALGMNLTNMLSPLVDNDSTDHPWIDDKAMIIGTKDQSSVAAVGFPQAVPSLGSYEWLSAATTASNIGISATSTAIVLPSSRPNTMASIAVSVAAMLGQGTVIASGTTSDGLLLAVLGQNGAQLPNTRNFNVLVGGVNGLVYSPSYINASPGDTVSFIFGSENHTVTQSSFTNPCQHDFDSATSGYAPSQNDLLTTNTAGSPVLQYTVADTTPQWFFCEQAKHCQKGMVFAINVPTNQSFFHFLATAEGIMDTADNSSTYTLSSTTSSDSALLAQASTASDDPSAIDEAQPVATSDTTPNFADLLTDTALIASSAISQTDLLTSAMNLTPTSISVAPSLFLGTPTDTIVMATTTVYVLAAATTLETEPETLEPSVIVDISTSAESTTSTIQNTLVNTDALSGTGFPERLRVKRSRQLDAYRDDGRTRSKTLSTGHAKRPLSFTRITGSLKADDARRSSASTD